MDIPLFEVFLFSVNQYLEVVLLCGFGLPVFSQSFLMEEHFAYVIRSLSCPFLFLVRVCHAALPHGVFTSCKQGNRDSFPEEELFGQETCEFLGCKNQGGIAGF